MIVTIHQPEHIPWLGFFNKITKADVFVILDSVQYEKNYFQNRNRILGSNGVQWLSIPVVSKGHIENMIMNIKIASSDSNPNWRQKYLATIQQSYGKHPYFEQVFPILRDAILLDTQKLCDINLQIIYDFAGRLGISPKFVRSSNMNVKGAKSDLILDICKEAGAKTYIAGPSGRDYLELGKFRDNGIKVLFNDFHHPVYPQRKTKTFMSHLSSVDLFMNCGFDEGLKVIMEGNQTLSEV